MSSWRSASWGARFRAGGARVGRNFRVQGPVEVLLRDGASLRNLHIGDDVTLGGRTYIRLRKRGRITLGDGVATGTEVWLVGANDATLAVGPRTTLATPPPAR